MIRLASVTLALAAALVFAGTSSSIPPPVIANVGVSRGNPVAGRTFTAFTVTPGASALERVNCDATLDGKDIEGRSHRFYASANTGPLVAVTCGWNIPATARGTLVVSLMVESGDGFRDGPTLRWRIKH